MKKNLQKSWLKNKIIPFIKNNKLLLLVVLFFIVWKFFLIYTMWHGRNIAPEPDDSFIYISHINSVIHCPSFLFCKSPYSLDKFGGYEHLSYRLFFGTIGKILHLTATQTYHLSFYIGILLLVPVLIYFLKKITRDYHLQVLGLFFLSLYNGAGSYHGFFWIVPTFFSVLIFFLMLGIFLDNKSKYWIYSLPILSLTASLNHFISIYASVIFLTYLFVNFLFTKKIDFLMLKKTILIILFAILPYFHTTLFIHDNPYNTSGLDSAIEQDIQIPPPHFKQTPLAPSMPQQSYLTLIIFQINKLSILIFNLLVYVFYLPGYFLFKTEYLNWLFPNFIGVSIFCFIILMILFYKKYKIITLYLSALAFTIISMKSIYGVRSLVYLWPITFLLYAYGIYYGYKYLNSLTKKNKVINLVSRLFYYTIVFMFIFLNLSYAYLSNKEANLNNQINLPKKELEKIFLNNKNNKKPYCRTTVLSLYPVDNSQFVNCNIQNVSQADIFLTFQEKSAPSLLQKIIFKIKQKDAPQSITKTHDKIPKNFSLYKQVGDLLIYKRN
jgi:hypothetical protein